MKPISFRLAGTTLAAAMATTAAPLPAQTLPGFARQIDARAIVAISDGDFRASTYRDSKLSAASGDFRDVLTVLQPGGPSQVASRAELPVTNSVTGPPEVMAVSPDGRFAYVVERLGPRTPGAAVTRDLAPGRRVSAIDLCDPAAPRLAASIEADPMLESVRVSPDGRFLVMTANSPDSALVQIVPTNGGALGAVQSFALADLLGAAMTPQAGKPRGGIDATYAEWHPSGRFIAVNLNTRNQIAFFEVQPAADGRMALAPWGAPVTVGSDPFVGRFTPDGGHYVSSDWGRDFTAKDLAGRLPAKASQLSLIKLASTSESNAPRSGASHAVVATVPSDRSAEGLAISRDGRHIATINMRETALATDHPRYTKEASISYFSFDAARSRLTKVGDYPFEGVLPEGGTFDASGKHFLATVFEYAGNEGAGTGAGGGIEVWRVGESGKPGLTHVGRIPMPHGVHHVEIVR